MFSLLIREVKEDTENILDDTQAIRQDTSRLPEMHNDVSRIPKLVAEIFRLKLPVETLARLGTQDNILIQKFLDNAATYADSEYGETMSNVDDVAFTKQEDRAVLNSPLDDVVPRPYRQLAHNKAIEDLEAIELKLKSMEMAKTAEQMMKGWVDIKESSCVVM